MIAQAASGVPLLRRLALIACMFLTTASMGFLQPFVPLYLEASGLSRQQIGGVTGLGAGLAILLQPVWGSLSDRLDTRRPFMSLTAGTAGPGVLVFPFSPGGPALLVVDALGGHR